MSRDHDYFVYMVTNFTGTVLYTGVTSDLEGRLWEHANGESGSKFTRKYHVNRLVFYEHFREVQAAIAREKQLKGWTRAKKEALVRAVNPGFEDLGAALGLNGACRRPEGPSTTALRACAQEDRNFPSERVSQPTEDFPDGRVSQPTGDLPGERVS